MNSLLGNFGNTFLNATKGMGAINPAPTPMQPNILMQAFGAAMRGESPQQFMQNLANQHPQLRQLDLSNLQQTAEQVCAQNGVNSQQVLEQIDNSFNSIVK